MPTPAPDGPSELALIVSRRELARLQAERTRRDAEGRRVTAAAARLSRRPSRVSIHMGPRGLRVKFARLFLRDALAEQLPWGIMFAAVNPGFIMIAGIGIAFVHLGLPVLLAPVAWIVLNDGQYGMVKHGMDGLGLDVPTGSTTIPMVDIRSLGRALGAHGITLDTEASVAVGLEELVSCPWPVVIDARIDPSEVPPYMGRIDSLKKQIS